MLIEPEAEVWRCELNPALKFETLGEEGGALEIEVDLLKNLLKSAMEECLVDIDEVLSLLDCEDGECKSCWETLFV